MNETCVQDNKKETIKEPFYKTWKFMIPAYMLFGILFALVGNAKWDEVIICAFVPLFVLFVFGGACLLLGNWMKRLPPRRKLPWEH